MVFTNAGIQEIRDWLRGASADYPDKIDTGTGSTAVDRTDTALESREKSFSFDSICYGSDWVAFIVSMDTTQQNSVDFKEFGLQKGTSTAAPLFQRVTHTTISKHDQLELEYEVVIRLIN